MVGKKIAFYGLCLFCAHLLKSAYEVCIRSVCRQTAARHRNLLTFLKKTCSLWRKFVFPTAPWPLFKQKEVSETEWWLFEHTAKVRQHGEGLVIYTDIKITTRTFSSMRFSTKGANHFGADLWINAQVVWKSQEPMRVPRKMNTDYYIIYYTD